MSVSRSTPTNSSSQTVKPFDTGALVANPLLRALYRPLQGLVEKRLGFPELNRIYVDNGGDQAKPGPFCQKA